MKPIREWLIVAISKSLVHLDVNAHLLNDVSVYQSTRPGGQPKISGLGMPQKVVLDVLIGKLIS